jgi:hypothetical protein
VRDRAQLRHGETTVSGPGGAGGVGFPRLRVGDVDVPGVAATSGIAATAATMWASSGAKGAAVLAGACVTVVVVVGDGVLVFEESHPAGATPTTAMMVGTAARRMTFRPPGWIGRRSDRSAT